MLSVGGLTLRAYAPLFQGLRTTFSETLATLPGGLDLAHAIRLGIKPFAELAANSEALSESQVDSPCSCRAIFESAPVAMLQSPFSCVFEDFSRELSSHYIINTNCNALYSPIHYRKVANM